MNHGIASWEQLNGRLKNATEEDCLSIMKCEKGGKNRKSWLLRIHHRLNLLRGQRERKAL